MDKPTWNDRVTWPELCCDKKCVTTNRHYHTARGTIVYMSDSGTAFIQKDRGGLVSFPARDLKKETKL